MSVRIDSLSVNGLGPIASIQWALKDINLVYGKNEQGKTYLVEYLLSSLFKNHPKTRNLTDSGQVILSGLGETPRTFSPRMREKLEDLLSDLKVGAPVDLSRICVVKGGDTSFTAESGGTVTKSILKGYLSDQGMLEKISSRVTTVVLNSKWEDGTIIPSRQAGLIKDWNKAQQSVDRVSELLKAIDSEYSQGLAKRTSLELEEVEKKIELQQRAKRVHAYQVSTQIAETQAKYEAIPESLLAQARVDLSKVEDLQIQTARSNKRIEELQPKREHYLWLKSAIEECEKRPEGLKKGSQRLFIVLSVLFILATMVAAFFSPLVALGLGALSILFVILSLWQFQASMQRNVDREEVEKIFEEFENRTGTKTRTIASLKSAFEAIQAEHYELDNLEKQTVQLREALSQAEAELKRDLEAFGGQKETLQDPGIVINRAQENRERIVRQLDELRVDLATIQMPSEEYMKGPQETIFDRFELASLEAKREALGEAIKDEEASLLMLKQRVCDATRDTMAVGWEDLIDKLRMMYLEALEECRSIHAKILGGIFITTVISEMRKREDEQIYRALGSKAMTDPIKAITPNYTGVELDDDELVVFNDKQRFLLSEMSTGAKEQVLLALRIGLASHLLGDQKMFLILDDAFQHSDWNRRELLVDEMAGLAKTGWQVIYFSMDDHIRRLFEERVKPKFKERFGLFDLQA